MLFRSFCLTSAAVSAQAPQGIPYQAIARNASGQPIANTAVKVRFSIRDSIATGAIKYQETHSATTSALGLFSVNVGMGTAASGTFSGINWGKNAKFLQVEMDPAGGTAYTNLGTTQMMSVPYALHAGSIKMKTSITGDTLYTGGGNFLIIPGISAANPIVNQPDSPVTDIDGNVYQTVRIGTQVWMKENLKVSKYRNGNSIPTGLNDSQWSGTTSGAYSIYSNDPTNNAIFGKLYNWFAVADPRGLCPAGWHVPTDSEWYSLENYLDPTVNNPNTAGFRGTDVGGRLKAVSSLWTSPNVGATNFSGFTALPGGRRDSNGIFNGYGSNGFWWSSSVISSILIWDRYLTGGNSSSNRDDDYKPNGISVRCIKD